MANVITGPLEAAARASEALSNAVALRGEARSSALTVREAPPPWEHRPNGQESKLLTDHVDGFHD